MKTASKLCKLFVLSFALLMNQASFSAAHEKKATGEMKLDNSLSVISFVSIKKGAIGEVHTIKNLFGILTADGKIGVELDLASVDTKIEIRDERMRKHLFETEENPSAIISAMVGDKVSTAGVSLAEGEVFINLHGVTKTVPVSVAIVNTGDKIVITSIKPIIIKAEDYGLDGGVAMLQKLAKLPSIATAVPVNFVLTFSK